MFQQLHANDAHFRNFDHLFDNLLCRNHPFLFRKVEKEVKSTILFFIFLVNLISLKRIDAFCEKWLFSEGAFIKNGIF